MPIDESLGLGLFAAIAMGCAAAYVRAKLPVRCQQSLEQRLRQQEGLVIVPANTTKYIEYKEA